MLIREGPATELAVASRLLARAGRLAPDGRIAQLVGTEVVYLAARGVRAVTMTPYDVAALRLDGELLYGSPPDDAARYLEALRATPSAAVAALAVDGTMLTAPSVRECVETLLRCSWEEAEGEARVTGALVGAYPAAPPSAPQ